MGAIYKRELSGYFNSAIGYVVLAVYYFFSGLFFYLYCFYRDSASLGYVFANMFYIVMFIIPVLTMKTFSEERRQKTDQALLTSPVSLTEIVLGKFLGAFTIYGLCCAIFLVYGVVISFFAQPQWSVVLCTLLGMLLLGMAIIAMNIFISSLTESMVVAAVIGMAAGLVIDTMSSFSKLVPIPWVQKKIEKIDFLNYYTNFTYGILSIVDVIFFLSVTGLFLFFTVRVLERRRWS